ncbi:MAG: hypothetical protein ABSG49_11585 [Methanoregula sp.]|jgi:uncharacterized membrane-anchored protein|uniref:hypothetical protein n=1 Tax=Methanoregula sp. TaxID=2052170 RepID=UPI003C29EEFB
MQRRRKKVSWFWKIVSGITLVIGLWLMIVFAVPFFEHGVYLKFFLIGVMGVAFLAITCLLRA